MNVLSLFDGMSCGQIALERADIPVSNYYASEIDKYAIEITQKSYPNTIQLGDVRDVLSKAKNLSKIDLILAGSPCQGFSFAGKQLNFDDPRSALFFEFVEILNAIKAENPNVKFLLENVRMKQEFRDVISEKLGVDAVFFDSNLLSGQNRKRYYWTNIDFELPEDRGVLLKDVLEDEVDEDYYLTDEQITNAIEKYKSKVWKSGNRMGNMRFPDSIDRKSKCLPATMITGARETIHIFQINEYLKVSKSLALKKIKKRRAA